MNNTYEEKINLVLNNLKKSTFRSKFHLKEKDILYIKEKGLDTIKNHANDFVEKRLAKAYIENDGKQTPMKGHPVFIAQHATATCCRGCIYRWHHIEKNRELTKDEKEYLVDVIMNWIKGELNETNKK